jgi:hypothetical protein
MATNGAGNPAMPPSLAHHGSDEPGNAARQQMMAALAALDQRR